MANRNTLLDRISTLEARPPWSVTMALLSIVAAFIANVAAVAFVQSWFGPRQTWLLLAWTIAALLIFIFVFQSRRSAAERAALRLQSPGVALPLLLVINIGFAMLLDLLSLGVTGEFLPMPELLVLAQAPDDAIAWLSAGLLMVIAQPAGEELIFRGIAQPIFRSALGAWPGLLLSAVAYGIFHLAVYTTGSLGNPQDPAVWYSLILPTLHGLVFALNRAATGSTRAAILAHAAFGVFAVLKAFIIL